MTTLYALKDPSGRLVEPITSQRSEVAAALASIGCVERMFNLGLTEYQHRAGMAAARALGWRIVRVKVTEIKK